MALDGAGTVQGYAFCIFQQYVNHNIMTDIKTLYIDDLCVDEACAASTSARRSTATSWTLRARAAATT